MKKLQLANTYNPQKNYRVASWYATPKFDGVRAVFIPAKGFLTRNNKTINGLDSMAEVLETECRIRGLSFVDGELVLAGGSFQTSQSVILASGHVGKSNIEYHVFAIGGNFRDTRAMLENIPNNTEAKIFKINSEVIPDTFEAVEKACRKFTAQGYEGVVLRHPDLPYFEGRSDHLLRYKFFKEADLRIIRVQEGAGRLAGTLGSLTVEGEIDGVQVRSSVGTGLTDEDRKILYEDTHLVGKVITVKYQELTDKPGKDGFYSLRFPSVIGLKEDRDFPAETARISQAMPEKVSKPSNVIYRSNGIVEAGFQIVFVNRPLRKPSYIPDKATMAGWKSKLYQCRNIQEGIQLIADLKLTIPKLREFARYLGVRLSRCRYLKAEIVKWLINGSLGARFRTERMHTIIDAVREQQDRRQKCSNKKAQNAGRVSSLNLRDSWIESGKNAIMRGSLMLMTNTTYLFYLRL